MKNYTITVNGNVYDVTVEETGSCNNLRKMRRVSPSEWLRPCFGSYL